MRVSKKQSFKKSAGYPADPHLAAKAKQAAVVLRVELAFDKPPTKRDLALCDQPPSRRDLRFKQAGGADAARTVFANELSLSDARKKLFCVMDQAAMPSSSMDIDHVLPFSEIQSRQKKWLAFLNRNSEFADALLTEADMNHFFGKAADGTMKGTKYFYKVCYNQIDNLWLICHPCNLRKSDLLPIEWFRQQPRFGQAFIDSLKDKGDDLHEGIIFDRVYHSAAGDPKINVLGRIITLPVGDSVGFGQFITDWVVMHHGSEDALFQQFYRENADSFETQLQQVEQYKTAGDTRKAQRELKKLKQMIAAQFEVFKAFQASRQQTVSSDSGEDSSVEGESRDLIARGATENLEITSEIKRIRTDLRKQHYTEEEISAICPKTMLDGLDLKTARKLRTYAASFFSPDAGGISLAELQDRISAWYESNRKLSGTEHQRLRGEKDEAVTAAEEERRAKEEERRAKEEERRAKEEERRAKEALAIRVKELEQQLALPRDRGRKRQREERELTVVGLFGSQVTSDEITGNERSRSSSEGDQRKEASAAKRRR